MAEITVRCGCGRAMYPVGTAGPGAFACGCGARIQIKFQEPDQCAGLSDGGRCRTRPSRRAAEAGLMLCEAHFERLLELIHYAALEEAERDALRDKQIEIWMGVLAEDRGIRDVAREEQARRVASGNAIVYYIRLSGQIKIGWTADLARRMHTLQPDEILATEPGGRTLETQRHREFRHLQVIGERFRPGADLLAHIAGVKRQHGDPPQLADLPATLYPPAGAGADRQPESAGHSPGPDAQQP